MTNEIKNTATIEELNIMIEDKSNTFANLHRSMSEKLNDMVSVYIDMTRAELIAEARLNNTRLANGKLADKNATKNDIISALMNLKSGVLQTELDTIEKEEIELFAMRKVLIDSLNVDTIEKEEIEKEEIEYTGVETIVKELSCRPLNDSYVIKERADGFFDVYDSTGLKSVKSASIKKARLVISKLSPREIPSGWSVVYHNVSNRWHVCKFDNDEQDYLQYQDKKGNAVSKAKREDAEHYIAKLIEKGF